MNSHAQQIQQFESQINRAKQLLHEIFPKTNDPRMFLGILELLQNTTKKLKKPTNDPKINTKLESIITEIDNLISTHQNCPTEIKTKNKIIMYSDAYNQKITITDQDLNSLISKISNIIITLKKS